ncbi:unnamed protein product [Periconia digitata]|uniref:Uncharacterized protein n=1 Tax=Periconia digitata TaxID=1303443 RepID=A0A9W4UF10_9PLEO|nr:unnamed protein product [Periconia digitata]
MAPPALVDRGSPKVIPNSTRPLKPSRLPSRLRLVILLVLNLGLQAGLLSASYEYLGINELGSISKQTDPSDLITPLARLAYKVVVVWLGWKLNYDFIDISALTAITNLPYAYLLMTYFNISITAAAATALSEIVAIALPTYLLRPRSAINNHNAPVPNRYLLNSFQVNISNFLLAIGVYVAVLYSALKTGQLNTFLVSYGDVKTVELAYEQAANPWTLLAHLLIAGAATKTFILNPSIGAAPAPGDVAPVEQFDPASANLSQTLKHNFWFFSQRTRTLIKQTSIASAFLMVNTVRKCLSLDGFSNTAAAGYAGLWVVANIICAGWWVWVGDADS